MLETAIEVSKEAVVNEVNTAPDVSTASKAVITVGLAGGIAFAGYVVGHGVKRGVTKVKALYKGYKEKQDKQACEVA